MNRPSSRSGLAIALVLVGAALRVWAYAENASLYLDEVLLARNVLNLPIRHLLTKPLLLDQVAPRGFLLVERSSIVLFGPSELALRLFPFLCALASLILFWRAAYRALTDAAAAMALGLFAIGVPFIRFGADVKQYAVDILAAIVLLLLALDLRERDPSTRRLLLIGAAGLVVIWFSQASVLVMAGLGVGLAADWVLSRNRHAARALAIAVPIWAGASLVAVAIGLRSMTPATRAFMHEFWSGGFLPLPVRPTTISRWLWEQWVLLFSEPTLLRYRWPALFVGVALAGFVALWRQRRSAALLLIGPFVVCMMAAAAQQYPFRGRLVVWLLPGLLLAVAAGAEWIRSALVALHPAVGAVTAALAVSPVLALADAHPPYEIEHHRELLGYLRQHRQPGDRVHVLQVHEVGTAFYAPGFGLMPADWTMGVCDEYDVRAYIRDVDKFRGVSRLWLLSGSGRPLRAIHALVRSYLGTIGVRRDSMSFRSLTLPSVGIDLYDLSDPVRLRSAAAATFPVPPMPTDPRPGCREWTRPESSAFRFLQTGRSED